MAGPSHQQPATADSSRTEQDNANTKEDVIDLLDETEALELVEFDPTVQTPSTWDATKVMVSFLEKHFNCCLMDDERTLILRYFLKPNTPVLQAPKLDDDIKEQLKKKGKDPISARNEPFSNCKICSWMCLIPSCASGQT